MSVYFFLFGKTREALEPASRYSVSKINQYKQYATTTVLQNQKFDIIFLSETKFKMSTFDENLGISGY